MAQPFYYIFIIIVIALILIFGYSTIKKLQETQERAKFIQFKSDLNNNINNVYLKNPSTKISFSLIVPKDAKQICFDKISQSTKVSSNSKYFNDFNNNNLVHDLNNPYCINVKNEKISFTLENKVINDKTFVSVS